MLTHRFFIAFLVAATCSHVAFAAPNNNYDTNQDYELCTTQDCVNEASRILDYVDRTIDPCDNFYKFACGGWIQKNPANISYPRISSLSIMGQKTLEEIRKIVEGAPEPADTISLNKARKVYNMCMDTETLEKIGISGLRRVVKMNGGWPITMTSREWRWKGYKMWQQVSNLLEKNMLYNGLYGITVSVDEKKSDTNIITIVEPDFYAPRDILIGFEKNLAEKMEYKSLIEKTANIFIEDRGVHINSETLSQDALDLVDFEIELAKLTLSLEDVRDVDKTYNLLTIQELQRAYDAQHPTKKSKINWHYQIQKFFAPEGIKPSEKLVVQAYKYLTSLVSLLERTNSRTIINYMQWTHIRNLLPYTKITEPIAYRLAAHFKNESPELTRWKSCLNKDGNLHTAISQKFATENVQLENKKYIGEIIKDIANVVREQITASTWMDEPTKKVSLEKLDSMREQILIPEWYSNEAIDKYYNGLTITSDYLESAINIFKFESEKVLQKLRKPVDKNEWLMQPTIVNAYYDPSGNIIVIPAAITQNPVYDKNRPAFMNYGALGVVVGHEINHGFDNTGRKYDKNGNAIEWWTQKTINNYEEKAQCFVDQYNGYLVPGLENVYVNGKLSLGENIGDSAGLVAAYYAYMARKARLNEPELRLQGLEDYSDAQIFFMGFAQAFCQNATPEQIRLLQTDEHPMPETRVRGSYSNFPEFSKAYNCPAGKGMNPDKKCSLW